MHFNLTDLAADITQNGAESGAELLELEVRETASEFRFTVKDNGKGMSEDELKRAKDPFVTDGIKHPHRKVGLGLPFLIQTAQQSNGGWDINSQKGQGTVVSAWFDKTNVDVPPLGDIPGLFRTVLLFTGPKEIVIKRQLFKDGTEPVLDYEIKKTELVEALGGDLEEVSSLVLLRQYLNSLEGE